MCILWISVAFIGCRSGGFMKRFIQWSGLVSLSLAILLAGCAAMMAPAGDPADAIGDESASEFEEDVAPVLVELLSEQKLRRTPEDIRRAYEETILKDIIRLTTPAGYRLKVRYRELGVPVVQALAYTENDQLQSRLLEAARWMGSTYSRSEALLALASQRNPDHLKYFREALLDQSLSIQFAGVEALQIWNRPEGTALLMEMAVRNWSPFVRVYAAQAAWSLGNAGGRDQLTASMQDKNWVVRAMATRYLGDMGTGADADFMLSRIGPEQGQPFVLAETCIAALKLTAKKSPAPPPPPEKPRPGTRKGASMAAKGDFFELEPLIITAPRRFLPPQPVDVRIDNELVSLLEKIANEPLPDEKVLDPDLAELMRVVTPTGFALRVRYTDLSFLIIEGLAGSRDFGLIQRVEKIARENPSVSIRAAALVSLAYDRSRQDALIYQEALRDPNVAVRFGALEALEALDLPQAQSLLANSAVNDASLALRIYAAQALFRKGDSYGRQLLLQYMDNSDYVARAMSIYYLGALGTKEDAYRVSNRLLIEENDFASAEACLAMMKLDKISQ
jgi:HEAT repeat protein